MKKVVPVLAGLAAVGGSLWLLHRKFGKPSEEQVVEFEENDEPIVMDEEADEKANEDSAQ